MRQSKSSQSTSQAVRRQKFAPVKVEIPAAQVAATQPDVRHPSDILSAEELAAFAMEIENLVDELKYRSITDRMLNEIERDETAKRRIPPARLRLAQ